MPDKEKSPTIAFFGTPDRAVYVLHELKSAGILPTLIITQPDRPQGRKLIVTPPPVKVWAQENGVSVIQPEDPTDKKFIETLKQGNFDIFIVVAYGKILKKEVLDIPKYGALNLHASLLPLLRGSSPIETAILNDMKETGVTIIKMDEKMDHGPIVASKKIISKVWPLPADDLAKLLVSEGGKLFAEILPQYIKGSIKPQEQDHTKATVAQKIVKEDGLVDLSADAYKNFLKYNAYKGWPGSFFFETVNGKQTRITITEASYENSVFTPVKVIPEGKKEILWSEYKKIS